MMKILLARFEGASNNTAGRSPMVTNNLGGAVVLAGRVAAGAVAAAGVASFDGAADGCALMAVATNKNAAAVAAAFLEQIDNTNNRLICIGPVINVLQW